MYRYGEQTRKRGLSGLFFVLEPLSIKKPSGQVPAVLNKTALPEYVSGSFFN